MNALLQNLKIAAPGNLNQKVCTVNFNQQLSIHFVHHSPGFVDVICEAGILSAPNSAIVLRELLALNSLDGDAWPISVTLHNASNNLVVWSRQELAKLDVSTLLEVVRYIHAKAAMVRLHVEKTLALGEARKSSTMFRMAQLNRNVNK
ncbi:CesT family type III secretion system chaperone [Janthinobacterium agaricidamnosum]|nr:CesT family type III secretion system chaperone [Janthinobacterium agaricidamnosum]